MDKIFLSALNVECIVGIWDWERRVKQNVIIDVELAADIRRAAATDHIDNTVDYKKLSKRLQSFVGESSFGLVETLAERCAEIIMREFGVAWVRLKCAKPGAVRGAKSVGVVIERGKRPA